MSLPPKVSSKLESGKRHGRFSILNLIELLENWTAVDILTRHGPEQSTCLAHRKVELEDEIRKLVFSSSDLVKLGKRWGMLK
jgi:hypothetical protein